jgi:ectoine hydroxylase-related dioxygenase (phytanoyl-CoA dioxygenase family)
MYYASKQRRFIFHAAASNRTNPTRLAVTLYPDTTPLDFSPSQFLPMPTAETVRRRLGLALDVSDPTPPRADEDTHAKALQYGQVSPYFSKL